MEYEITCRCGKVVPVSEGMAGSSVACECGEAVNVPSLGTLRGVATAEASPAPAPDDGTAAQAVRIRPLGREVIGPTRAWLRIRRGAESSRQTAVIRRREAREAMDQALGWMRERNRKAENDPALQWQNRLLWSSIEPLIREARSLLEGVDPPTRRPAKPVGRMV